MKKTVQKKSSFKLLGKPKKAKKRIHTAEGWMRMNKKTTQKSKRS